MNLKSFLLAIPLISLFACSNEYTTVRVVNQSETVIDSIRVTVQTSKLLFINVPPGKVVEKKIAKADIHNNNHDVLVLSKLYLQKGNPLKDGLYYFDLSGEIDDEYTITVNKDLSTSIRPNPETYK